MFKTPKQLFDSGFLLIDLETTGLPSPGVAIVEVAVMDHEGNILLNTFINPECPIPFDASRINGIYESDVEGAPTFGEVYPQLAILLAERDMVAYNHEFEMSIFKAVCKRVKLSNFPTTNWHCAMRAYSNYRQRQRYFKLTQACDDEGIKIANAHRALGDCMMTLELMRKMAGITTT